MTTHDAQHSLHPDRSLPGGEDGPLGSQGQFPTLPTAHNSNRRWSRVALGLATSLTLAGWSLPARAIPPTEDTPEASPSLESEPLPFEAWSFCDDQPLQSHVPGATAQLSQTACQLLTFPTDTRSERESFDSQVEPGSLTHHTQPSSEEMTLPSMWWNRDSIPSRLGGHRLVDDWIGYTIEGTTTRIIDVTISPQFWQALKAAERYGVVSRFGSSAQEFGYQLRFLRSNGYNARLLGLYVCEPDSTSPGAGPSCMISVDRPQIVQLQRTLQAEAERLWQVTDEPTPVAENSENNSELGLVP
ncbi:MAG: hypothetical protein HC929_03470 [Leptolyngbyaceae cyanobacterium SM2_5_2]|nr:hypothetical protein [Leptolyngbyaceae cyanobacterium SM2_5_2]